MKPLLHRATEIYRMVQHQGARQVRLVDDRFLTFCYPAPRGYGVRGMLVAVYDRKARRKWIAEDLLSLARELHRSRSPIDND